MDELERQKKIVEYLQIKSTSHGQIYTFQMAVPTSTSTKIDPKRFEAISHSLIRQRTNLVSLIVRRTKDYAEEEEYEVIYGVDWYLVAKEIGIEKLWVWVFDMTDEEAQIAQQEMDLLAGRSEVTTSDSVKQVERSLKQFEAAVESKLETKLGELFAKIEKLESAIANQLQEKTDLAMSEQITLVEPSSYSREELNLMPISKLKPIAKRKGLKRYSNWRKDKLIDAIMNAG